MATIGQKMKMAKSAKSRMMNSLVGQACPACGCFVSAKAKFCTQCGTEMYRQCPNCGENCMDDDVFCPACGKALPASHEKEGKA